LRRDRQVKGQDKLFKTKGGDEPP